MNSPAYTGNVFPLKMLQDGYFCTFMALYRFVYQNLHVKIKIQTETETVKLLGSSQLSKKSNKLGGTLDNIMIDLSDLSSQIHETLKHSL